MISLIELLHSINSEKKEGLIHIDDWKYPNIDHLINMGFEIGDDFKLNTPRDPKITVYKKEEIDETPGTTIDEPTEKKHEYFYVEVEKRKPKRFREFNEVIEYFDRFEQPEIDKYK